MIQDDVSKMNDNLSKARKGCDMIYNTLMKKQLSVNHDKCKYMIMGTKKFREETLKELEKEPMKMGGVVIDHAVSEKYLGDWVNELGCRQSIADAIKERMRKLTSKGNDIIMLVRPP